MPDGALLYSIAKLILRPESVTKVVDFDARRPTISQQMMHMMPMNRLGQVMQQNEQIEQPGVVRAQTMTQLLTFLGVPMDLGDWERTKLLEDRWWALSS